MTSDESIWSFWTLVKAKRPRLIGKRLEPITIAHSQLVARALLGPHQDACGCFSRGRLSCAEKKRYDALGYKPPAGSQLTETRYAIIAWLESTRRCESAPVVSSRSMVWVIPKPGKVGFESCRLVHGLCDIWKAWHRGLSLEGTWPELPSYCYGFQRAPRREGAVASHLLLAARCRHEGISFVDESLDMANAFGSLDRKN